VKEFSYVIRENLHEVIFLPSNYASVYALLARGTDLIVQMKRGIRSPSTVINPKRISNLNGIYYSREKGLSIGPLGTHNARPRSGGKGGRLRIN
jgi:CO/xanthine dehydrogenase FAD-binding subunit